jgi:hypothetical protein
VPSRVVARSAVRGSSGAERRYPRVTSLSGRLVPVGVIGRIARAGDSRQIRWQTEVGGDRAWRRRCDEKFSAVGGNWLVLRAVSVRRIASTVVRAGTSDLRPRASSVRGGRCAARFLPSCAATWDRMRANRGIWGDGIGTTQASLRCASPDVSPSSRPARTRSLSPPCGSPPPRVLGRILRGTEEDTAMQSVALDLGVKGT